MKLRLRGWLRSSPTSAFGREEDEIGAPGLDPKNIRSRAIKYLESTSCAVLSSFNLCKILKPNNLQAKYCFKRT